MTTVESKKDTHQALFEEEEDRLTLLPLRYPDIWEFRKKLESLRWQAQEVLC